jgi:hypothetical protein
MHAYLRSAQQGLRQGWSRGDPEFGGWSQTGGAETELKTPGETNVSATRAVLEALQTGGVLDADSREAALAYLARCQNWDEMNAGDGGFYFTADATDPRNKAGAASAKRALSYGSTTVDGLRALIFCGEPESSPRRRAAAAWLQLRFRPADVPGFPSSIDRQALAAGLYYYYAAGLADCLRRTPEFDSAERRSALIRAIVDRQEPDGSWRNPSPLMREDDPLIATAFAIAALGRLCE